MFMASLRASSDIDERKCDGASSARANSGADDSCSQGKSGGAEEEESCWSGATVSSTDTAIPGAPGPLVAILGDLDPYLDVHSILQLSLTAKVFQSARYALGGPPARKVLRFAGYQGCDGQLIIDKVLRNALRLLTPNVRSEGVELDLTGCVSLKDSQLAYLTSTAPFFVPQPDRKVTKLTSLKLDFCPLITDKGLSALVASHLPHLASLSLRCVRSENLKGEPFKALDAILWPRFKQINLDFTSVSLECITDLARSLTSSPGATSSETTPPSSPKSKSTSSTAPSISFVGSWASKVYLETIGAKQLIKTLILALNTENPKLILETAQHATALVDEILADRLVEDPLAKFVVGQGSRLLVNIPVVCPTSEEGGVNVWTLPISVAVRNGNVEIVKALRSAGADLDVVDHLGKSPLVRATTAGDRAMVEYMLSENVPLTPPILTGPSAINVAIECRDSQLIRLFLEKGCLLNHKCPAIKNWKTPLMAACDTGDEYLIHLLLDWGGNPNICSGPLKSCAPMSAYRANPRFLLPFLFGGHKLSLPIAGEILSAAIAKNDVPNVELLTALFPEVSGDLSLCNFGQLLRRPHPTWSYPHIQATKMGKVQALKPLLTAYHMELLRSIADRNVEGHVENNDKRVANTIRESLRRFHKAVRARVHYRCRRHGRMIDKNHVDEDELPPNEEEATVTRSRVSSKGSRRVIPVAVPLNNPFSAPACVQANTTNNNPNHSTQASSSMIYGSAKVQHIAVDNPESAAAQVFRSNPVANLGLNLETRRRSSSPTREPLIFGDRKPSVVSIGDPVSQVYDIFPVSKDNQGIEYDEKTRSSRGNHLITVNSVSQGMEQLLGLKDCQTGYTALHYASEDGNLDCLEVLLAFGCNVDTCNSHGQTALHCACTERRKDVAEYLMRYGALLEVRDGSRGESPLMVCIRMREDDLALSLFRETLAREAAGLSDPKLQPTVSDASTTEMDQQKNGQPSLGPMAYAVFYGRYEVVRTMMRSASEVERFLADLTTAEDTINLARSRLEDLKTDSDKKILRRFLNLCDQGAKRPTEDTPARVKTDLHLSSPSYGIASSGSAGSLSGDADIHIASAGSGEDCSLCSVCDFCSRRIDNKWPPEDDHPPSRNALDLDCSKPDTSSSVTNDRASKTRQRARRLQLKLRSAARRPFNIFYRVKNGETAD